MQMRARLVHAPTGELRGDIKDFARGTYQISIYQDLTRPIVYIRKDFLRDGTEITAYAQSGNYMIMAQHWTHKEQIDRAAYPWLAVAFDRLADQIDDGQLKQLDQEKSSSE